MGGRAITHRATAYFTFMRKIVMNKYRNEFGRMHRREYECGLRNEWCCRSNMRSYQCRPDKKSGVVLSFVSDNLILEIYETTDTT